MIGYSKQGMAEEVFEHLWILQKALEAGAEHDAGFQDGFVHAALLFNVHGYTWAFSSKEKLAILKLKRAIVNGEYRFASAEDCDAKMAEIIEPEY